MNRCRGALLASALFAMTLGGYAQDADQPMIKEADIKIDLEFVSSPKIGADNVSPIPGASMNTPKWLEVMANFTMPKKTRKVGGKDQVIWIDDFTALCKLLIPAEYNGKKVTALLTGKSVFTSVPCDGLKHRISMFVPPVIISRYTAADFKTSKSQAKDIPCLILFQTKQQVTLGAGLQVPRDTTRINVINNFKTADSDVSQGILKLEDVVLPRERTPWASLDFDAFEMPKSFMGSK